MKIIAEIGTAHGGSLKQAETLVKAAVESGAQCVKFQIVYAHEILHPLTGSVPLPGGDTPLFKVFQSLERSEEFYSSLKDICDSYNTEFLATPFGFESARILKNLKSQSVKVASPELNYSGLLDEINQWQKSVILSSGVSRLSDIEEALEHLKSCDVTLLHCVTSYPAPEIEYNLGILDHYRALFSVNVGVSDHSLDPCLVPGLSYALGASVLEKHFTLSRSDTGLDDPIALDPSNFRKMCDLIDELAQKESRDQKISLMEERFGKDLIHSIIGTGQKVLASCEMEAYGRTNRSIHALKSLKKGDLLTEESMACLRTEKILRPGMHPRYFKSLLGKRVQRDIPNGEGILLEDILEKA